jgi:hypothetical protein
MSITTWLLQFSAMAGINLVGSMIGWILTGAPKPTSIHAISRLRGWTPRGSING